MKILIGIVVGIVLISGWWILINQLSIQPPEGTAPLKISVDGNLKTMTDVLLPIDKTEAETIVKGSCESKDSRYSYALMKKVDDEWRISMSNINGPYYATVNIETGETNCMKQIPFEESKEVSITTDKTEYGQGESVNITLSHSNKPIYVELFGTRYTFYQLKGDTWERSTTSCETNCIMVCENDTLKQGPCAQYALPLYYFSEYKGPWEIQWNQKECIYETKLCGTENYREGSLKQVSAGKFKVEFCYFDKEDVDLSEPPGSATPDKKKCVEQEFTIQNRKCDFSQNSESYESRAFYKYNYEVYDNYVMVSGSLMVGGDILIKEAKLTAGDAFYLPSGEEQEVAVRLEKIENNKAYFKFSFRAAPPACKDTVSCNYECDFVIEK